MSDNNNFFNLYDQSQGITRNLTDEIKTRIFQGDKAMLSVVTIAPYAAGTIHSHPEEQWGVMLEGDGVRIQDGEEYPVKSGDFWRTPGDVEHGIKAGNSGALVLDIFSPPRKAYTEAGSGFDSD